MKNYSEINICNFVPVSAYNDFQTINYVYETKESVYSKKRYQTHYRLNFITDGRGNVFLGDKKYALNEGDVFIEFPSYYYSLENVENFAFCYIDFIGIEASQILRKLLITPSNFIFRGYGRLKEVWLKYLTAPNEINDIASKSVTMLTLTDIGCYNVVRQNEVKEPTEFYEIKKYVDENFENPELNLNKLSEKFFYSTKYISLLFVKNMKIGFSEYLKIIRLQNARSLIERKFKSVKNIALLCGFKDALYFSKVYKKYYGNTPSKDIEKTFNC